MSRLFLATARSAILTARQCQSRQNVRFLTNHTQELQNREQVLKTSLKDPLASPKDRENKQNEENKNSRLKKFAGIFVSGAISYFAITYALRNGSQVNRLNPGDSSDPDSKDFIDYSSAFVPGKVKPVRTVSKSQHNPGQMKITLYQFATCPFCCKVRAYLDYYGYNYDVVEVNSVSKKQLDWTKQKKVPQLFIQFAKETPEGVLEFNEGDSIQLKDSSVIISALETYRLDPKTPLSQVVRYFEPVRIDYEDKTIKGNKEDFINKYFVMLHNENVNDGKSLSQRKLEREWRSWVDTKFIHAISPNVYRTFAEAKDAFDWYDSVGQWSEVFSSNERTLIKYTGSLVMHLLGFHIKRKYELNSDVRVSLYEFCNEWTSTIDSKSGVFRGGVRPDLSDLALYGCIESFEGCLPFVDMMKNASQIKSWYDAMKEQVGQSKGSLWLNNPVYNTKHSMNNCKKDQKK